MSFIDDMVKRVRDYDAARPRSLQREPGWSEVGGCSAALGFQLDGAFATDDTDKWPAQVGTALHLYLESIVGHPVDLSGFFEAALPGVRTEISTTYRGIPGHADLVGEDYVGDIKTTRLANSKLWAADFSLLRPKRIQAHGYAAGLVDAGELPGDCLVRLLVIPVDGTFADWWAYEEPFDRSLADEGADRLEWVRDRLAAGEALPKEKPYAWCESYCEFFSLCRETGQPDGELITDPELAAAVARYGEINAIIGPLEKEKKALASVVRGLRGIAGDWRVSTSEAGDGKTGLDEERVRADYYTRGMPVPEVTRPGNAPRLTVTRIKKKAEAA